MENRELTELRLWRQHLSAPADKLAVCRELNGVQAQFCTNARHALHIRGGDTLTDENWGDGLLKSWTVRGTMHVFAADDLPLYFYAGRPQSPRAVDRLEADEFITLARKKYFARLILELVACGCESRAQLKEECFMRGMSEREAQSVFDPWGGTPRALAAAGRMCYQAQEKKAFCLCATFVPLSAAAARLETARRYFSACAPASVRDAAYYFGTTQTAVKEVMAALPLETVQCAGREYFQLTDSEPEDVPACRECIFLAGFDPLLLSYRKEDNPFLPPEYLRGIFNKAGIVMPALLLRGRVAGRWRRSGRKLTVTAFRELSERDRKTIRRAAESTFGALSGVDFV